MDLSRVSFGEAIAAASGLALFIFMFLPWYGGEASVELPGGQDFTAQGGDVDAWSAFGVIDLVLFLVAVLAVAMAVARALGAIPTGLNVPPGLLVAAGGLLAVLLILYRLIDVPGDVGVTAGAIEVDFGRRIGIFLALIAAAGISFGGYTALGERASSEAPPAT